MQPLPLANLRTAGEDPSTVLGLPTPCLSQMPWCTLLGPCPLPLLPSSPGPPSWFIPQLWNAFQGPNQGKHDKNLPWSSPPVLLAHCTPMCQMWVTPRLHPPTPRVPPSSHLVLGVCSPSPRARLLPWGPPLVSHTRIPVDFVAQMREETAGPTVICGSCLLGTPPPARSFSPHGNWRGGVLPSPWDLNEVSPAMGRPTLPTLPGSHTQPPRQTKQESTLADKSK